MRTTVTLDPDVRRILEDVMKERGIPFKQALNDAVRTGLAPALSRPKRRFVQKTYSPGAEQHFRWDKALAAADAIEDEELVRKLAQMKILDVNLLIYAVNRDAPLQAEAKARLQKSLAEEEPFDETRPLSKIPIDQTRVRRRGGMAGPARGKDCRAQVAPLLDLVRASYSVGSSRQPDLGVSSGRSRNRTKRARFSCDSDFARFPGLRWKNPLTAPLIQV